MGKDGAGCRITIVTRGGIQSNWCLQTAATAARVGLLDLMETGFISHDENVVFIHTGGTPALFPYRSQMMGLIAN